MTRLLTVVLAGALALGLALPAHSESFSLDSETDWSNALASGRARAPAGEDELGAIQGMEGTVNYGAPVLGTSGSGDLTLGWTASGSPSGSAWIYDFGRSYDVTNATISFSVTPDLVNGTNTGSFGLIDAQHRWSGLGWFPLTSGANEIVVQVSGTTTPTPASVAASEPPPALTDVYALVFDIGSSTAVSGNASWDYVNIEDVSRAPSDEVPEPGAWVLLMSAAALGGWIKRRRT